MLAIRCYDQQFTSPGQGAHPHCERYSWLGLDADHASRISRQHTANMLCFTHAAWHALLVIHTCRLLISALQSNVVPSVSRRQAPESGTGGSRTSTSPSGSRSCSSLGRTACRTISSGSSSHSSRCTSGWCSCCSTGTRVEGSTPRSQWLAPPTSPTSSWPSPTVHALVHAPAPPPQRAVPCTRTSVHPHPYHIVWRATPYGQPLCQHVELSPAQLTLLTSRMRWCCPSPSPTGERLAQDRHISPAGRLRKSSTRRRCPQPSHCARASSVVLLWLTSRILWSISPFSLSNSLSPSLPPSPSPCPSPCPFPPSRTRFLHFGSFSSSIMRGRWQTSTWRATKSGSSRCSPATFLCWASATFARPPRSCLARSGPSKSPVPRPSCHERTPPAPPALKTSF